MPCVIVVGAQWGDEGKGKIVDFLTQKADVVVRFQGGHNAGHTVVVGGEKTALQLIPSGILRPHVRCLLASGVVVDPKTFFSEVERLRNGGVEVTPQRLGIDGQAHLILPYHQVLDAKREEALAGRKIGTTGKGIGPAYEDAVSRFGIRVADLYHPDNLQSLLVRNIERINSHLEAVLGSSTRFDADEMAADLAQVAERLAPYVTNVSLEVAEAIQTDRFIMFEGAQGCLLDVNHGTFPYVTSSNTIAGQACVSAGFGPNQVNDVIGICKAYTTRVGSGPFPTEDYGSDAEVLRAAGGEFGTVTGRPRRCGWLDAVLVRRAARLNGITSLVLTKLDVLSGFDHLKIGVGYCIDGKEVHDLPDTWMDIENIEVTYEELDGWKEDISGVRSFDELPESTRRYIRRVEELVECEIGGFSVGPDREQTVVLSDRLRTMM